LIVLLLSLFMSADGQDCKPVLNGIQYDFTPLKSPTDYHVPKNPPIVQWDTWINMCTAITTQTCGTGVAACQVWDPNSKSGHASLGSASSLTWQAGSQGPVAQFTGGDMDRQLEIDFVCDPNIDIGNPSFVIENPTRHYIFQWNTSVACETVCIGYTNCLDCTFNECKWQDDSASCSYNVGDSENVFSDPKYCPSFNCYAFSSCNGCVAVPLFLLFAFVCQDGALATTLQTSYILQLIVRK